MRLLHNGISTSAANNGSEHALADNGSGIGSEQSRGLSRQAGNLHKPMSPFKPKRALIVSKSSLLEYEFERAKKCHFTGLDDQRFISKLLKKHANIADLRQRHELQQQYISTISNELERHDIEWKVVRRRQYSDQLVDWSDLIISAGGDGTFLAAAKRVLTGDKPVIGINTDPVGSEGFLCLTGKSRRPADEVIRQFLAESSSPDFRWMWRQRIRLSMIRPGTSDLAFSNSSSSSSIQQQQNGIAITYLKDARPAMAADHNSTTAEEGSDEDDISSMSRKSKFSSSDDEQKLNNIVNSHRLALNEVFIGESHAARVSYYDVQVDNGPMTKQKSSGMTICTGTGSTSWHFNINRMTEQTLTEILTIMGQMGINFDQEMTSDLVECVCRRFNDKLKYGPELQTMAFSVRDPVFNATFPKTPIRGFAKKILLKSRCTNAHLILDGSMSIPFNRGAEVLLEIHPEDALRTTMFKEEDRS